MKRREFVSLALLPFLSKFKSKKLSNFKLHPLQAEFFESKEEVVMYGGSLNLTGLYYHHYPEGTNGEWLGIKRA